MATATALAPVSTVDTMHVSQRPASARGVVCRRGRSLLYACSSLAMSPHVGAGGILWAVFFTFGISLPPVLKVGSQYLKYVHAHGHVWHVMRVHEHGHGMGVHAMSRRFT